MTTPLEVIFFLGWLVTAILWRWDVGAFRRERAQILDRWQASKSPGALAELTQRELIMAEQKDAPPPEGESQEWKPPVEVVPDDAYQEERDKADAGASKFL